VSQPDWYRPPAAEIGSPETERWEPEAAHTVGFWPRVAARFVDGLAAMVVSFAAGALSGALPAGAASAFPKVQMSVIGAAFVGWIVSILGNAAAEAIGGATIGKLVLGMRVRMVDGSRCTFFPALKRSVAYIWDAFFFGLVAYSAMKKDGYNQRTGDRWADTLVVRVSAIPTGLRLRDLAVVGAAVDVTVLFGWHFFSTLSQIGSEF
jgi:uncharacterized RDD family membrane protein YckC